MPMKLRLKKRPNSLLVWLTQTGVRETGRPFFLRIDPWGDFLGLQSNCRRQNLFRERETGFCKKCLEKP